MAKKSFKTGFDSLLGSDNIGSSYVKEKKEESSKKNEIRATFIVQADQLENLKAISFWERKLIKTVLCEALDKYINDYKVEKGELTLPKK